MYVYQVCFSMYRSYHICRRLWIWSEVAPGCQGITLQILSRLRQSYPNGPKELKSGILQQKYVFWHLRTLQSSFACFTASPGKYGEAAALLQGLQSSQLALAIGLALWNGLSCRRPHPTSWGHRACGLCPRLTVLRFPLIPTSSSALCSLFCRILTSIWKHMPWTELVLLRAMTSYDCFRFHCDCLIQLRMSMKQLYVVVHSCTYLYTIESILYSFFDKSLSRINYVWCFAEVRAAIFDAAGAHSAADPASRSRCVPEVHKFLPNRHELPGRRLEKFVLWLCRECWCFSSWRGKDGKGHPVETSFTMFHQLSSLPLSRWRNP